MQLILRATIALFLAGSAPLAAHADGLIGGLVGGPTNNFGNTLADIANTIGTVTNTAGPGVNTVTTNAGNALGNAAGSVGYTVGNVASGAGTAVGTVASGAGGTVNTLTSSVGNTLGGSASNSSGSAPRTGNSGYGLLGMFASTGDAGGAASDGAISDSALKGVSRSTLRGAIDARLAVLTKSELVRLCLNVGGGPRCGGERRQVEKLIDARLGLLSKRQLANACVSIGASCAQPKAGTTKVAAKVLSPKEVANARVRSNLIGNINAKAKVLSRDELARLCVNAGGGSTCGNGNRSQVQGAIDTRLAVLSPSTLLNLCLSVGGSCGTTARTGGNSGGGHGGGNAGGGNNGGGNNGGAIIVNNRGNGDEGRPGNRPGLPISFAGDAGASGISHSEMKAAQKRCPTILRDPAAFDDGLVKLCKVVIGL